LDETDHVRPSKDVIIIPGSTRPDPVIINIVPFHVIESTLPIFPLPGYMAVVQVIPSVDVVI
jgi:hypothetical protein